MNAGSAPPKPTFIHLVVVFDGSAFGLDIDTELQVRSDVRALARDIS
jgi:hypothetical protein